MSASAALGASHLETLAAVAETTLGRALAQRRRWVPDPQAFDPALRVDRAAFVTVERGSRLLGCVGTLEATRPLVVEVADRTLAAAFHDPRTTGVTSADYAEATLTVSVLSALHPVPAGSLEDLAGALEPGSDGLVLTLGRRRATFLPAVWDRLPHPAHFVEALCRKAQIEPRPWPEAIAAFRYRTQHGVSTPPRPAPGG